MLIYSHCHEQFMIHLHVDTSWKAYVMSAFVIFRNQFRLFTSSVQVQGSWCWLALSGDKDKNVSPLCEYGMEQFNVYKAPARMPGLHQ